MLKPFNTFLRFLFFAIVVRFIVLIVIGLNIRHKERLPSKGPAIIVANHNSHLDTLVLISLFNLKILPNIHPVAAADYFLKNKFFSWFSKNIIGVIPIFRNGVKQNVDPLVPCYQALDDQHMLILFPEGTRGEPEQLATFKKGVAHLAKRYPDMPIVPIFIHGLGKALPKGEVILVPFFCDIFVGHAINFQGENIKAFMDLLNDEFKKLMVEADFKPWE